MALFFFAVTTCNGSAYRDQMFDGCNESVIMADLVLFRYPSEITTFSLATLN
jgi:hypothetical protein